MIAIFFKESILQFPHIHPQVYPSELESIMNSIEGVISSCVVGVQEEFTGEDMIYGFVVKDRNNDQLTEDFIANYVKVRVIDAKQLRGGVLFLDDLPLTINGKLDKAAIKKIAHNYYHNNI